ncbi:hypothetical protein G6L46_30490 [Agrobacterium rhizogenes]|uniref:RolB family protein n=1 Tax=Rhizobium rhizogenes TaxID=359 RepID=UPI001571B4A8|nr:RolB family protein [Rhizobium rhizogenes]NTF91498.1 hypothetical protein [Rhizobium rhizogenes]
MDFSYCNTFHAAHKMAWHSHFLAKLTYIHNTMAVLLAFFPRFQPRNLNHPWSQINLFEEIRCAFSIYTHVYRSTLMNCQMKWAEGVLQLDEDRPAVKQLKDIAELLESKICYHAPMLVTEPDLAREEEQQVFIYLTRKKMEKVLKERCVTFGREPVLATTIQPYRSDLSVQEMVRAHNLVTQFNRTKESDLECFIAIFASTLFVQSPELKVTNLYGRKTPCTFFIRPGTENRLYDVVACGPTLFTNNAISAPTPIPHPPRYRAVPFPFPDLTLRLSINGGEDNADDEYMKPAPRRIKTRRLG